MTIDDEHDSAGHSEHFLQRLDRLDPVRTELALMLYRDHEVVAAVLEKLPASRGTQRVALGLAPGAAPPYVLVTHEARFVTCLGAGMHPTGCHVVTFERLCDLLERIEVDNYRLRMWRERDRRGSVNPLKRLVTTEGWVAREDISAILAVQPAMEISLGRTWLESFIPVVRHSKLLAEYDKPSLRARYPEAQLRAYWRAFRSLGHLGLVATATGGAEFVSVFDDGVMDTFPHWEMAIVSGEPYFALQTLNAVARLGRPLVPLFKRGLARANSREGVLKAAIPLAVIGARHASLAAEVRKVLQSTGPEGGPGYAARVLLREFFDDMIANVIDNEGYETRLVSMCSRGAKAVSRALADAQARGVALPPAPNYRDDADEQFERDQRAVAVNSREPFDSMVDFVVHLTAYGGWAARAAVEDFYAPDGIVKLMAPTWSAERAWAVAERLGPYFSPRPGATARAEKKPGRNDPCSCGSGKKYKKCCGG